MSYEYAIRRDNSGSLRATTVIPFGYDRRELRITTYKRSTGGLVTSAQAVEVDPDGRSFRFTLFQDFNKVMLFSGLARCTERNIREMHELALRQADAVLAEAKAKHPAKEVA